MLQLFFSFLFIVAGFYLDISKVEWMFQILAISLVLTTESLNTAIEKILDFVHPDYNEKVGYIKDISAGAVFFAFIFALFTALMIYLPKLL